MSTARQKLFLIATLLAMGCVAETHAQETSAFGETSKKIEKFTEKFDAADTDHDGFLTRDEAAKNMPRIAKHFDAIDADHDGKLSPHEIALYFGAKRNARDQ